MVQVMFSHYRGSKSTPASVSAGDEGKRSQALTKQEPVSLCWFYAVGSQYWTQEESLLLWGTDHFCFKSMLQGKKSMFQFKKETTEPSIMSVDF